MEILAGTSGYAYKEWKGTFYPEDLPQKDFLDYYARRFRTVEINNTFYRMPSEKLLMGWTERVPETFRFVLKASQRITHHLRLKGAHDPLEYLVRTSSVLEDRLGPTLFQLPPNLRKDADRLRDFLAILPDRGFPAAFEFRHATWFDDEIYEALRAKGAALCLAETEEEPAPRVATAPWGYLRLRKAEYPEGELEDWAAWVRSQTWDAAYVFFKHEDEGTGPRLAARFLEVAGAAG